VVDPVTPGPVLLEPRTPIPELVFVPLTHALFPVTAHVTTR